MAKTPEFSSHSGIGSVVRTAGGKKGMVVESQGHPGQFAIELPPSNERRLDVQRTTPRGSKMIGGTPKKL